MRKTAQQGVNIAFAYYLRRKGKHTGFKGAIAPLKPSDPFPLILNKKKPEWGKPLRLFGCLCL